MFRMNSYCFSLRSAEKNLLMIGIRALRLIFATNEKLDIHYTRHFSRFPLYRWCRCTLIYFSGPHTLKSLLYIYSNRTFIKSINIHGDRHTFLSALNNYTQSSDTITYYLNPQRDYSNILQNYHAVVGLKLAIAIRTETRGHIGNISC